MRLSHQAKILFFKELAQYFRSPLGYLFLVIFLFGTGYLTFELGRGSFFQMRISNLDSFFTYIPWMFLFLIPAVSMRLWAEERKSGTIELLLTMPIKLSEAVMAKFMASWAFILISLILTFPIVITVNYLGNPDFRVIALQYLASFFMAGALLSVGGFFSALSKNQVTSFILTTSTGYLLMMAGSPPVLDFISSFSPLYVVDLFEALSILNRFDSMGRGVLALGDLWFFFLFITLGPYATVQLLKQNKAS